jgi:thioredoxin reductase (NADPH)
MEQIAIIGSGPAGLTAAVYTARANLSPVVIEGLQPGGQLTTTTEVENYPGFEEGIDGAELVLRMRRQAERFGARVVADEVTGADFGGTPLKLTLGGGETIESRTVIIATGASARYLGLESERALIGRGVSGCATCDGAFFRGQNVAVIGGGDTAMEDALFLSRLCERVTIIHRRDAFRASRIMADRVAANPKIGVLWNTVVDEVLGVERKEVAGLSLRDVATGARSTLDVTGVFMAIGHTPNTAPFRGQVEMTDGGFIRAVDTRTNVTGVYAAGDVQDPHYKQAVTAAGSGCMAALLAERYLSSIG